MKLRQGPIRRPIDFEGIESLFEFSAATVVAAAAF
jgi:hypothetical protein